MLEYKKRNLQNICTQGETKEVASRGTTARRRWTQHRQDKTRQEPPEDARNSRGAREKQRR